MPSTIPPGNPPDIYSLLFSLLDQNGRTAQMISDTQGLTVKIAEKQDAHILELTRLQSAQVEQRKDHEELKATCIVNEGRTFALEQKNTKRAWVIGTIVTLCGFGGSAIWQIVLNWEAIQKVIHHGTTVQ